MKQCEPRDMPRILEFYQLVIRETEEMSQHARWEYGKHPTKEMIENYVKQGMMYYLDKGKEIAVSVVVTPFQTSEYHRSTCVYAILSREYRQHPETEMNPEERNHV